MNKNIVLILAAHPDDEVLGCGGIIQKYKKNGGKVCVCIVTDGSSRQYAGNKKIARKKNLECKAASKLLNIDKVYRLDFPDMNLDTVSHFKLNQRLEKIVKKVRPSVIYTHSSSDLNKDHVLVNQSTMVIVRPGKNYLKEVYAYEVLSSTEWHRGNPFQPNIFVNIEPFIKKKVEAFLKYKTEIRPYPHPRSKKGIEALAQYRGLQAGKKFAEAFELIIKYD